MWCFHMALICPPLSWSYGNNVVLSIHWLPLPTLIVHTHTHTHTHTRLYYLIMTTSSQAGGLECCSKQKERLADVLYTDSTVYTVYFCWVNLYMTSRGSYHSLTTQLVPWIHAEFITGGGGSLWETTVMFCYYLWQLNVVEFQSGSEKYQDIVELEKLRAPNNRYFTVYSV